MGYERMHSYRNRPFWNLHISGLNTILCFISSVFLLSDPLIVYFVLCNCKSIGHLMAYGMFIFCVFDAPPGVKSDYSIGTCCFSAKHRIS